MKIFKELIDRKAETKKIQDTDARLAKINAYLDALIKQAPNNLLCTHVAKYIDTYCPQIGVLDKCHELSEKADYLCTANTDYPEVDVAVKDGSANGVHSFLLTKLEDGMTILEHLQHNTEYIRLCFSAIGISERYNEILDSLCIREAIPNKTSQLIKQVYFPLDGGVENYHIISVLPSTVLISELTNRIWQKLTDASEKKVKYSKRLSIISHKTAEQISRLVGKNHAPQLLMSLPPAVLKKSYRDSIRKDALIPDEALFNLPGIKNGMLAEKNSETLQKIIEAGMPMNAKRVWDYERSDAVKREFLAIHGYKSVPCGFELHHIIPLSQGGADSVQNMILLFIEEHDEVTKIHKEYYGWRN